MNAPGLRWPTGLPVAQVDGGWHLAGDNPAVTIPITDPQLRADLDRLAALVARPALRPGEHT
ncbi:hypothetical protein ABZW30_08185 [Kitasatospora sp. NPDC004669]|uniref:hypothetical protein n=1 Tax=Kitasatospora sp. NPDC004669 TaxID=3154555 RepID=UPI0033A2B6A3